MSNQQILEKAIQKAIDGGWKKKGYPIPLSFDFNEHTGMIVNNDENDATGSWLTHVKDVIYSHDFAKALWGEDELPYMTEDDIEKIKDEENLTDEIDQLGLYRATGGGYEGYGDYVDIEFLGQTWQYHLQMMVIDPDPIKYLGEHLEE